MRASKVEIPVHCWWSQFGKPNVISSNMKSSWCPFWTQRLLQPTPAQTCSTQCLRTLSQGAVMAEPPDQPCSRLLPNTGTLERQGTP